MARYINMLPHIVEPETSFGVIRQHLLQEGFEYTVYDGENVFKKGNGWITCPTFIKISYPPNAVQLEAWVKYPILPGVFVGEYGMTGFVAAAGKGPMKRNVAWIEQYLIRTSGATRMAVLNPVPAAAPASQICAACGAQMARNVRFCTHCGTQVGGQEQDADSAASSAVKEESARIANIDAELSGAESQPAAAVQTPVIQAEPQPSQPETPVYHQPVQTQPQQPAYGTAGFCTGCGTQIPAGTAFCRICGRPVGAAGSVYNGSFGGPNGTTPIPRGQMVSKSDFRKHYAPAKFYKDIKILSIVFYVLAGINVLSVLENPAALIDVILVVGLTLGMQLGKSKGCAIGLLVYSIVSMLVFAIMLQTFGGWLWLVLSILALKAFGDADKQYRQTFGIL